MRHFTCDKDRQKLSPDEVTTLKVNGPLAAMIGRRELHLSKPAAAALGRWLGYPIVRPELEERPGPDPLDADVPAGPIAPALVVKAPQGKGRRKSSA